MTKSDRVGLKRRRYLYSLHYAVDAVLLGGDGLSARDLRHWSFPSQ